MEAIVEFIKIYWLPLFVLCVLSAVVIRVVEDRKTDRERRGQRMLDEINRKDYDDDNIFE